MTLPLTPRYPRLTREEAESARRRRRVFAWADLAPGSAWSVRPASGGMIPDPFAVSVEAFGEAYAIVVSARALAAQRSSLWPLAHTEPSLAETAEEWLLRHFAPSLAQPDRLALRFLGATEPPRPTEDTQAFELRCAAARASVEITPMARSAARKSSMSMDRSACALSRSLAGSS